MALIEVVFLLLAAGLFFGIFYGPWQTLCVDWARQRMFEARDNIFDLAKNGDLEFDSEEYRSLRVTIEGMIRFAHVLTWPRLLFWEYLPKPHSTSSRPSVAECINRIQSDKTRSAIRKEFRLVAYAILLCVAGRSIFLAPLLLMARCVHYVNDNVGSRLLRTVERDAKAADFPDGPAFAR